MIRSELNGFGCSHSDGVSVYEDVQLSCVDSITGTLLQPPTG